MKAATKEKTATTRRGASAARRTNKKPERRSLRSRLPALSRAWWIAIASVLGVAVLGVGGYLAWRSHENAVVPYDKTIRSSPAWKSYSIAVAAANANRGPEAESAFQRATTEDPSNAMIYDGLATLYIGQGEVQKAAVVAETGINRAPGWPPLYYTLGLARYQSGRFDDAAQALDKALALNPDFGDARLWLGNTYLLQSKVGGADGNGDPSKLDDSVAQLRRATEIDDSVAEYHSALAEALYQRRDLAEARAEMERAVRIDPSDAKYQRSLGKVCDQLNDLDAAEAAYRTATKQDDKNADGFYGLGLALFKKQQDAEAADAFRAALKINPFLADAHEKLGQTLVRLGDQDESQAELKRAEDSRARAKTIDDMRRASAANPADADMANNLGIELARQGDFDEAMQAFHRALAANPRMIDAQYQIGGLYAERSKWPQAFTAFNAVDKAKPGYRRTNYYLAKVADKMGYKTEAAKRQKMFEEQQARGEITDN